MENPERILRLARRGPVTNAEVAAALDVSRATAHRRLAELVAGKRLRRVGSGRAARYELASIRRKWRREGLTEDEAWRAIEPELTALVQLTDEDLASIAYCATEMLNNAIDHSDAQHVDASAALVAGELEIVVADDGIGVFDRVMRSKQLPSRDDAVVQLEKGKLTTMPSRHSGEGIFFTSKIANRFRIDSADRAWIVDSDSDDTAIAPVKKPVVGTRVTLTFVPGHIRRLADVFARFTDPESHAFEKTRTTVKLAAVGRRLLSRSEARRIVSGLDRFAYVTLDFHDVDVVGQGFCDEVFRVWARAHPRVTLDPARMGDGVAFMVRRALAASA